MKARARLTTNVFAFGFAIGLMIALATGSRAETALLRATQAGSLCGFSAWLCSRIVPVQTPVRSPTKDRAA